MGAPMSYGNLASMISANHISTTDGPIPYVEIHSDDAATYGIESGDYVRMFSDDILIQTTGFNRVDSAEISFTWLMENEYIRVGSGEAEAVAIVTEAVKPGLLFSNFLWPSSPTNSLIHWVGAGSNYDPLSLQTWQMSTRTIGRIAVQK